jgi:hypothetical protein
MILSFNVGERNKFCETALDSLVLCLKNVFKDKSFSEMPLHS